MESFKIENLTFSYPNNSFPSLNDISLSINQGEFVTVCGKSGCGKSTLLRQLKPILSPYGTRKGMVIFEGNDINTLDAKEQSEKIGFVMQSPDNQIVTDKVWHELAFGLESLSYSTKEIRSRVAEMASFFGIQTWFHKKVTELSGGQKQLLNLASIMVMQPSVLILDEPTSQLDPIAATDFLETVAKINSELGTTVIITEHRLEEVFPLSDRVVVMDNGTIIADGTPETVGTILKNTQNDMFYALPTPMRVYSKVPNDKICPITVRDGRRWLTDISKEIVIDKNKIPKGNDFFIKKQPVISLSDIWFRYEKEDCDVVRGLSAEIYDSEIYAIVGGNGTGKTTTLSIINGLLTPYRGKVNIYCDGFIGLLPQNPQALFVKKTVELDLYEMLCDKDIPKEEKAKMVQKVCYICELEGLMQQHPYDLSGGEQQRAALAKVLLLNPKILLLDEPTKGLDAHFKEKLADILSDLLQCGITVVMVSHDIEFCARYASRCAMFFDGNIISVESPRKFFSGKSFYTTAANRMARSVIPEAVLPEDIILACGGEVSKKEIKTKDIEFFEEKHIKKEEVVKKKKNIFVGIIFAVLFAFTQIFVYGRMFGWGKYLSQILSIVFLGLALDNLLPQKLLGSLSSEVQMPKDSRRLTKRTIVSICMILLTIPLTIYIGVFYLADRKYIFISLLIILQTCLPFVLVFENRRPKARELIIISVLCALAISGRTAFYMFPQFNPVIAIVIISGVCFGGETGFMVGAITGFVSNMFLGQGPWTPWQMFAFGIIGFFAGFLFQKGILRKTKVSLCIFGGISAFVIYGGIMNPSAVLMYQAKPNLRMFMSAYLTGIPFDLVHAVSTVFFLWFISETMIEKLDRIKIKYGLVN